VLFRSLRGIPTFIENDANLAGLSEAISHKKYSKVLYITIGTGIGGIIIINGKIDPVFADMEPGRMVLSYKGRLEKWEDFASGKAIKDRYGKLASEINDDSIWTAYAKDLALGFDCLLSVIRPEIVIIGGGVGAHFSKFGDKLEKELKRVTDRMVEVPPIIQAKRPEEAVIYGCYEYIKQSA